MLSIYIIPDTLTLTIHHHVSFLWTMAASIITSSIMLAVLSLATLALRLHKRLAILQRSQQLIQSRQPEAYLATSSDPTARPLNPPSDNILRGSMYFFHVSAYPNEPYPIVPVFNHWVFPHDILPPPWASLQYIRAESDIPPLLSSQTQRSTTAASSSRGTKQTSASQQLTPYINAKLITVFYKQHW
ncbi:uncharacterized protein F4812DRAFT_446764 [Daldinia caldariorum]|uniref:uncharacterized protein n=1 Tax=Daldinia caldariorum TaxID=326644 RepID=UPI002008A02A|nr:uncharacterized protein F4812DRAFT_446764 [Daldinia caldariorum]KAI1463386.1 hypothetical protein F4812DRAFT_446764 [Daldinia caldariorum]